MAKIIKYAHDNGALALLSVGGWSSSVSLLWAIKNKPTLLAENIVKFINDDLPNKYFKYDVNKPVPIVPNDTFYGIDIDLEPYSNHWDKMSKDEINNFVDFIGILRDKLGQDKVLSIAISGSPVTPHIINDAADGNIAVIADNVDKLFLMSYDYHGNFDSPNISNFQSPLYYDKNQPEGIIGRKIFNTNVAVHVYASSGFPADKIVLGYPSYGRGLGGVKDMTSHDEDIMGLYQQFNPKSLPKGQYDDSGVWDYFGIKNELIANRGYKEYFSKNAGSAFAYNVKEKVFISYDNPESVFIKTCYAKKAGLNGVFTWTLGGDREKDLLKAANHAINEECSQESKMKLSSMYGPSVDEVDDNAMSLNVGNNNDHESRWWPYESSVDFIHHTNTIAGQLTILASSIVFTGMICHFCTIMHHDHID